MNYCGYKFDRYSYYRIVSILLKHEPRDLMRIRALELTPINKLKVVILGQDPYIKPGVATGLAFSTTSKPMPKSLLNILKELATDLNAQTPLHGDLTKWAKQGVLLLNTALTVGKTPGSHLSMWRPFTDKIIKDISDHKDNVVFILWGKHAQSKLHIIDRSKHLVIQSAHPSPLSAKRGFFGSKPFSRANEYLVHYGIEPIDWKL